MIDADLGLAGDLRAAERTSRCYTRWRAESRRADRPGTVMLQTFQPKHPVMQALVGGDRDRFIETEADARKQQHATFGRLQRSLCPGG